MMLDKLATNVVVIVVIANFKCCALVKSLYMRNSAHRLIIMFVRLANANLQYCKIVCLQRNSRVVNTLRILKGLSNARSIIPYNSLVTITT